MSVNIRVHDHTRDTCVAVLVAYPRSGYNDSTKSPILSLKALNPGSGGEIPAIWHGTGACHGHIYPKILVQKARLLELQFYPQRGGAILRAIKTRTSLRT